MPASWQGPHAQDHVLTPGSYVNMHTLTTTAKSVTIPSGYDYVRISASGAFGMRTTGTAAAASDVTDGTGTEYFPAGSYTFRLDGLSTISLIAQTGTIAISQAFFRKA